MEGVPIGKSTQLRPRTRLLGTPPGPQAANQPLPGGRGVGAPPPARRAPATLACSRATTPRLSVSAAAANKAAIPPPDELIIANC